MDFNLYAIVVFCAIATIRFTHQPLHKDVDYDSLIVKAHLNRVAYSWDSYVDGTLDIADMVSQLMLHTLFHYCVAWYVMEKGWTRWPWVWSCAANDLVIFFGVNKTTSLCRCRVWRFSRQKQVEKESCNIVHEGNHNLQSVDQRVSLSIGQVTIVQFDNALI